MKLLSLTCNNCGAPLEAPTSTRYLTCGFCNSRLEVKREGHAVYTDLLEALHEQTGRMADDLETIKLQNELERLDREWTLERNRHLIKGEEGQLSVPSPAAGWIGGLFAAGFGIFWTITAASIGAPAFFPIFGVVFVAIGIGTAFSTQARAGAYRSAQGSYERRRHEVLDQLRRRGTVG